MSLQFPGNLINVENPRALGTLYLVQEFFFFKIASIRENILKDTSILRKLGIIVPKKLADIIKLRLRFGVAELLIKKHEQVETFEGNWLLREQGHCFYHALKAFNHIKILDINAAVFLPE